MPQSNGFSGGLREQLVTDGETYFRALAEDIRAARRSVDMEVYIFGSDAAGASVGDALAEAAERGVRVRLLVDGVGSAFWGGDRMHSLAERGVCMRVFHPLPLLFWQRRFVGGERVAKGLAGVLRRLNRRNHRKVCLIDGEVAWVGSFNVDGCHLPRSCGGAGWRDTAVRLSGADFGSLSEAFDRAWEGLPMVLRRVDSAAAPASEIFRLNHRWRARRVAYRSLLRRIAKSTQRIWITNGYFLPRPGLLRRLRAAARRGVDVRILLPQTSDIFFMPWASAMYYRGLLKAGIRIFEYTPGVLHAKTLIVDDWMTVGSSNFDYRSFLHNLEVDVVLQTREARARLVRQFRNDVRPSREVRPCDCGQRPFWQQLFGWLCLRFQYWI